MSDKIALMRGRFQPFTKGHYESIRSYYIAMKKSSGKNSLPDKLILLLIRDHDTVRMAYPRDNDSFFRGNEPLQDFFRHLDFFNPFSAYTALTQIQHSIDCFSFHDSALKSEPDFQKFINNIGVVICPLKFTELVGALEKEQFVPLHMERYVNHIKDRIEDDVIAKYGSAFNQEILSALREAYQKSKEELINQVFTTWARFTQDLLPQVLKGEGLWFFPIFDKEDWEDYKSIQKNGYTRAYFVLMGDNYTYESSTYFFNKKKIGIYGLFIEYALFVLEQRNVIRNGIISEDINFDQMISERKEKIEEMLCCPTTKTQHEQSMQDKVMKAVYILSLLNSEFSSEYLAKKTDWNEEYVKKLKALALNTPYLVLIALINQLAHDKFQAVVEKVSYPTLEEEELEPLKKLRLEYCPLRPSYSSQLEHRVSEMKTSIKRPLLELESELLQKINNLAKKINTENINDKIIVNAELKGLFDDLIIKLNPLKVEDVPKLLEKITLLIDSNQVKKVSIWHIFGRK